MMKKIFALAALCCSMSLSALAQQADMPTIIVFPDDNWMNDHGYAKTFDNDGETEYLYNYNDAFVQTREMSSAISACQRGLKERGFQMEDLQALLKGMKQERARELANKADGDGAEKGAMDELMQQANPDIRVDLGYSVKTMGPRKIVTFDLKAVDAYTYDQIASCSGSSDPEPAAQPIEVIVRKFITGKTDDFCTQIMNHFLDLKENGREITVIFYAAEGSGINFLKDEIGEDEDTYNDFLHQWIRKHAVGKAAKKGRQSNNRCEFKNVRIPFFDAEGEPIDPETWAKGIRKAFKAETGRKISKGQGNTLGRVEFLVGTE